ncbi:hypothetical protein CCACVL1_24527 [Corchorus capsularis]|uniref:Transposase (putative) gypsy type domain-containing protein n=1 Tax=Corchorus capsularis TaxID=210143 RepID=A0A1R3GPG9_COCAP|nr:hypothetical protein CCACVL1_24527 [Corchorus capsularis]
MSQSGSSERTPDGALVTEEVLVRRRRSAKGQAPGGNNVEVEETSAANNDRDVVEVGGTDYPEVLSSDSSEEDRGNVVAEAGVEEPVQLDFSAPPVVLSEQLKVYQKYCKKKFPMVSVEPSDFQADAGNGAAYQYYICTSEVGLCTGTNGFATVNCEPGDRAFHIRKGGRVAFFYNKAFKCGFRLPAHPFIIELCNYYGVAPSQLVPNTWKILISYIIICMYKGWTLYVVVIRHLFQLQKRKGGWYAFQVRRGKKNKFPSPENNQQWQPKFIGVEAREGTEWGVPIQWWEINASKKNDPKGWVLSEEEKKHADYLQRVRHSPEKWCHRTHLYLYGLAPLPDAYDKMPTLEMGTVGPLEIDGIRIIVNACGDEGRELMMNKSEEDYVDYAVYNLVDGKLELASDAVIPEAYPDLIEEELDLGNWLVVFSRRAVACQISSFPSGGRRFLRGLTEFHSSFFLACFLPGVDRRGGRGVRRPSRLSFFGMPWYMWLSFLSINLFTCPVLSELPMLSKFKLKAAVQAGMAARNKGGQQSIGSFDSWSNFFFSDGRRCGRRIAKCSLQGYSIQNWRPRANWQGGSHGKHIVIPPRERSKSSVDFLYTLMTRSLKLGESEEIEIVESIEDNECAAIIVACTRQLSIFTQRMLRLNELKVKVTGARPDVEVVDIVQSKATAEQVFGEDVDLTDASVDQLPDTANADNDQPPSTIDVVDSAHGKSSDAQDAS